MTGLTVFSGLALAADSCATKDGKASAVVETDLKLSLADAKNLTYQASETSSRTGRKFTNS